MSVHSINSALNNTLAAVNQIASGVASSNPALSSVQQGLGQSANASKVATGNANAARQNLQKAHSAIKGGQEITERLKELATSAQNGALNTEQKEALNQEAKELIKQYKSTVDDAKSISHEKLTDGSYNKDTQVGEDQSDVVNTSISDISSATLNLDSIDLVSDPQGSQAIIEGASEALKDEVVNIGATQSALDSAENSANTQEIAAQEASGAYSADFVDSVVALQEASAQVQASVYAIKQSNEIQKETIKLLDDRD